MSRDQNLSHFFEIRKSLFTPYQKIHNILWSLKTLYGSRTPTEWKSESDKDTLTDCLERLLYQPGYMLKFHHMSAYSSAYMFKIQQHKCHKPTKLPNIVLLFYQKLWIKAPIKILPLVYDFNETLTYCITMNKICYPLDTYYLKYF